MSNLPFLGTKHLLHPDVNLSNQTNQDKFSQIPCWHPKNYSLLRFKEGLQYLEDQLPLKNQSDLHHLMNICELRHQVTTLQVPTLNDPIIVLKVTEYRSYDCMLGMPPGGSGFKGLLLGKHTLNACFYHDNFDGTYFVYCPVRENCVQVMLLKYYFIIKFLSILSKAK